MGAKRPPAVQTKAYVEIDLDLLSETGEVRIVGEPIIAPVITTKVPRGKFEIVYTSDLYEIVDKLGNQKMQVLKYLLENKDNNNCLNMTNTQLANAIGCSRPTVIETIKIMTDAQLLRRENSLIMISPNLMIKGNQAREAYLMRKYEAMDTENDKEIIESKIDPQLSISESGDIVEVVK